MPSVITGQRSEEHTSELQSPCNLVCRRLLEKKKKKQQEKRMRIRRTKGCLSPTVNMRRPSILPSPWRPHALRQHALSYLLFFFFFFNDTATTEIYTLSLHDALPISYSLQEAWRGQPRILELQVI